MTENQFSTEVKNYIKDKLKENNYTSLKVKERVNILNNLTIGKVEGEWKIVLGFLQQDIVIYKDVIEIDEIKNNRVFIPRGTKDKKIIIPLTVFELKISENLITHHFITYSAIARELKSVFPHCVYYFICSGGTRKFNPETLLRHTKEFDRIYMDWSKEKERAVEDLLLHLNYLKDIGII